MSDSVKRGNPLLYKSQDSCFVPWGNNVKDCLPECDELCLVYLVGGEMRLARYYNSDGVWISALSRLHLDRVTFWKYFTDEMESELARLFGAVGIVKSFDSESMVCEVRIA